MKQITLMTAVAIIALGTTSLSAVDAKATKGIKPVQKEMQNAKKRGKLSSRKLYQGECASCHMAYQPEFLPKRSWKKMMKGLENHFGVDATVEPEDQNVLARYLKKNAADAKKIRRTYEKFARSISSKSTPLRITEIPKFRREHRGIPKKMIVQEKVKSLSNCVACHKGAEKGSYSEHSIFIPNYGRWDD